MAKVIVVTNRKGGVGKTTVATHLAGALANFGQRTLLIDTDAQGHSSLAFGMDKAHGLYKLMCDDEARITDNLQVVTPKRYLARVEEDVIPLLYVLPGSKSTTLIPSEQSSPLRLRNLIGEIDELLNLDYVVIDTGPTASMFDGSVSLAADYFLYVTECAWLSYDGLMEAMKDLRAMNKDSRSLGLPEAQVLGIIPNKLRANTRNHRENIQALAGEFPGFVLPPIRELTAFETAMDNGELVWSFEYNVETDKAVQDMQAVLLRVFNKLGVTEKEVV